MLSQKLASYFDSGSRSRGQQYFQNNYVKIMQCTDTSVVAVVSGTDDYQVNLEVDKQTLKGSCTCPRFDDAGACKHIWATILSAQKRAMLYNNGKPITRYEDQYVDTIDDDEDYDDEYEEESYYSPRPAPVKLATVKKKKMLPQWQSILRNIHSQADDRRSMESDRKAWPSHRQVLYLLAIDDDSSFRHSYDDVNAITIEVVYRERKKDGDWSKPRPAGDFRESRLTDPVDQHIQSILPYSTSPYQYGYGYPSSYRVELKANQEQRIVEALCRTGRCCFKLSSETYVNDYEMHPLTWDDGPPWHWHLRIVTKPGGKQFTLAPVLLRGEEEAPLSEVRFLSRGGLAIFGNQVACFDHGNAYSWVTAFQEHGELTVPTSKADELIKQFHAGAEVPRLICPRELRFETVVVQPTPTALFKPARADYGMVTKTHDVEVVMDYEGERYGLEKEQAAQYDARTRRVLLRDPAAEQKARQRITELGVRLKPYDHSQLMINSKQLPQLVQQLSSEGWQVELEGKAVRSATGLFQFDVTSGIDWFELQGNIPFADTQASLPELLKALRKGEQYVVLEDGNLGHLPAEFLREFGLLARLGEEKEGNLRFKSNQAGLLDALLASRPEARCDATFTKVRKELQQFEGIASLAPPRSFQGTLRPYQELGLGWFDFLRRFKFGGCLADDMGLGKTVQVLALLEERRLAGIKKPTLVVVPRSLIFNWKQEAARFTPELKILDHSERVRIKGNEHFEDYDIILTTYAIMRMDILFFEKYVFDYVILDEAQAVKNDKSESAKAARLLRADHRLALSGTPIENHLGELWSLFEYLNPGMLGAASVFKLAGNRQEDPNDQRIPLLARALKPFILRRTKEQVAKDLPAKMEQTIYCEMELAHRKMYNDLRDAYRSKLLGRVEQFGLAKSKMYVLEALLRLRQAACHPGLVDKKLVNTLGAKLETLFSHLEEVLSEGRKVLVFSQFTSFLKLLRGHLDKKEIEYEYLDGSIKKRQPLVERFQKDPKCQLFLISLKAGGLGLNLTAAEYVFLLDPWWNPAAEAQAIDRAHRIGQQKKVFAYRLIVKDTVEEKVLELQQKKRNLADAIISADQGMLKTLQREDLELLLS